VAGELPETKRSEVKVIATIGTILVWLIIGAVGVVGSSVPLSASVFSSLA
jgi:hypothetical protein